MHNSLKENWKWTNENNLLNRKVGELNSSLTTTIEAINPESVKLTNEVSDLKRVEKFTNGKQNFENILGKQKVSSTRRVHAITWTLPENILKIILWKLHQIPILIL